jgi:hypothetical protein
MIRYVPRLSKIYHRFWLSASFFPFLSFHYLSGFPKLYLGRSKCPGVAFGGALAPVVLTNIKPLLVQVGSTTPEPALMKKSRESFL